MTPKALGLALLLAAAPASAGTPLIIYLGDTHTAQPFGQTLDPLLRAAFPGCDVETHGRCGAWAPWFLADNVLSGHETSCGYLDRMPGEGSPKKSETGSQATPVFSTDGMTLQVDGQTRLQAAVAVVSLGSYMILFKPKDKTLTVVGLDYAALLAKRLTDAGLKCVWVGAPYIKRTSWGDAPDAESINDTLNEKLKAAVTQAGCYYVDSLQITRGYEHARLENGLDYKPGPSANWAAAVRDAVKSTGVLDAACRVAPPRTKDDEFGGRL
jgi:hypothetical protein